MVSDFRHLVAVTFAIGGGCGVSGQVGKSQLGFSAIDCTECKFAFPNLLSGLTSGLNCIDDFRRTNRQANLDSSTACITQVVQPLA